METKRSLKKSKVANGILEKFAKKIDKLNLDLSKYFDETEQKTLPSVDSTIISIDDVCLFTYTLKKSVLIITDCDGDDLKVYSSDTYSHYEFEELIRYTRRRLNKAWRIFKSENPDYELERDEEENEN